MCFMPVEFLALILFPPTGKGLISPRTCWGPFFVSAFLLLCGLCLSACMKKERSIAYRRRYGGAGRASGSQIPEQNGCPCYTVVCAVAMCSMLFCEEFFFFYLLFKIPMKIAARDIFWGPISVDAMSR
ncbi:hypothetical protein V8C43DRAFT_290991 [Trichoderma afarasin]